MKLPAASDYVLQISAGPSYSDLAVVAVNDEQNPILINSEHFTGYLLIRVPDFDGVTRDMKQESIISTTPAIKNPKSDYFHGKNRRYSIVIQGRFKHAYHGDEIVFGVDTNSPIEPIPGMGLGIKLAKWLDPALEVDLGGPAPHLFSPIVSSMNAMAIRDVSGITLDTTSIPTDMHVISIGNSPPLFIDTFKYHSIIVPEENELLFSDKADALCATTYEKRKKIFANLAKRQSVTISPDYLYALDYYDSHFELATFSVRLPGFSLNGFKYWDGEQHLRYICKTRDSSAVFFVVQLNLIPRTDYNKK